jgi:hypothetical protein
MRTLSATGFAMVAATTLPFYQLDAVIAENQIDFAVPGHGY